MKYCVVGVTVGICLLLLEQLAKNYITEELVKSTLDKLRERCQFLWKKAEELRNNDYSRFDKAFHIITLILVVAMAAYNVLPMIILGENYVHVIHDGLDGAGNFEVIHNHLLYLHPFSGEVPILKNMDPQFFRAYYYAYDLYNLSLFVFCFLKGNIVVRILGTALGFFSMQLLLKKLFANRTSMQTDLVYIISMIYAITPIAPNRTIGFAVLPGFIAFFRYLYKECDDGFTPKSFLGLLMPFFCLFDTTYIFVMPIWFLTMLFLWYMDKKLNKNLLVSWVCNGIMGCVVFFNFLWLAYLTDQTNRSLAVDARNGDFGSLMENYLQNGQYHSTALAHDVIIPFVKYATIFLVVYLAYSFISKKKEQTKRLLKSLLAI